MPHTPVNIAACSVLRGAQGLQALTDDAHGVQAGQAAAVQNLHAAGAAFGSGDMGPAFAYGFEQSRADFLADVVFFFFETITAGVLLIPVTATSLILKGRVLPCC